MGLIKKFINWRKRSKEDPIYEIEDWNEIVYDRDDLQIKDKGQRQEYVKGCLEQIAEADLFARKQAAEAQKYEQERAAEARKKEAEATRFAKEQEAEGISAVGKAEAEAIRAKALAEAEGIDRKAEAMKKYGEAAVVEMIVNVLPDIARGVAEPLSKVDKITMYGEGNTAKLLQDIVAGTTQVTEGLTAGLGIDFKSLVAGMLGGKLASAVPPAPVSKQESDASPEAYDYSDDF